MKRINPVKCIILFLFAVFNPLSLSAGNVADEWALMPRPQKMDMAKGKALRHTDITYIVAEGAAMPVLYGALDRLPRCKSAGAGVRLRLDTLATPDSPEGYVLQVSAGGVDIKSRSEAGLFYGCVTLSQLLATADERGKAVPAMTITDWPQTSYRAVHWDVKHHLDRMQYYYSLIDKLAQWKVNGVIWEIEDKLQYESHPECSAANAISRQEMQALCRYAIERHVEISPLVQGLGHASFILKHHWELRENPASDWEFCPSDERYYELQFDLYRDALEAMPYGRFLHVGGDEISAIGIDERCRQTGLSPFELQMRWLSRVCDFVHDAGRTPIFWDDMPLKYSGLWSVMYGGLSDEEVERRFSTEKLDQAIHLFPKDCIYMRWHYGDPMVPAQLKIMDWYSRQGLRVMGATAAADGGSPFMPRYGSKTEHIGNFCRLAAKNRMEGIFATSWDDGSPHLATVERGFAALGEWGWHPDGRSIQEFKQVHARCHWGLWQGEEAFIDTLEQAAFFFDGALVVEGRRNPAWGTRNHRLLPLPDKDKRGEWSRQWRDRLDAAHQQQQRCEWLRTAIACAKSRARRNRYALDVYEQLCEQFLYPARLLTALEQADASGQPTNSEALLPLLDSLQTVQDNLVAVYSRTRFMQQPNGYVADMNHHNHLAALRHNADWIFLYERDFVAAVRKWLR